jgi:hypothetical protein
MGIGFSRPPPARLGQALLSPTTPHCKRTVNPNPMWQANPLVVSEQVPEGYLRQMAQTRHRVLLAMQV